MSHGKQTQHLRQNIHDISRRLMEACNNTGGPGFHELGHCLKFMGLVDEAIFAFKQQTLTIDDHGLASYSVCCNVCRSYPIKGIRRVCQICPDVDICESCVDKISSRDIHPVCQNHPFLEVSNQQSTVHRAQSTNTNCEEINSWLRTLPSRV